MKLGSVFNTNFLITKNLIYEASETDSGTLTQNAVYAYYIAIDIARKYLQGSSPRTASAFFIMVDAEL